MGGGMTWAAQARPLRRKRRYGPARQMMPPTLLRRYTGRRHLLPGERELADAVGWFDAKDLASTTQQTLPNRADGGATVAQFGSTAGADSSDPARLPHTGTDYVWFPGASGNHVYVNSGVAAHPESAEFEMRFDVEFWTLSPASSTRITTDGRLFVELSVGGAFRVWYHNGTTYVATAFASGMAALGVAAGERVQIRFVINTTTPLCTLYKRSPTAALSDDSGWAQVATVPASATPLAAFGASQLVMGGQLAAFPWHGAIYGVYYYDISNAAVLANFDVSTHMASATVVRATSGLLTTVVTKPVIVTDGTDDHLILPTSLLPTHVTPTAGAFTLMILSRTWSNGSTTAALYGGGNGAYEGLSLYEGSGTNLIATARDSASGQVVPQILSAGGDGGLKTKGMVVNNGTIVPFASGHTSPTPASMAALANISHGSAAKISSAYGNASNGSGRAGEYYAVVLWNRALTAEERSAAAAYLEAGSY